MFLGVPERFSLDALYPPTGLLYLAAMARQQGHEVKLVDGQVVGEEILVSEFLANEYDFFGTTILTPLRANSYALIRRIKSLRPECVVIAGGAHVSLLPEQTLMHVPEIDIVVVGEGELTLIDILAGKPLEDIKGIWYRHDGRTVSTGLRGTMDPFLIPMPAWDLIEIDRYRAWENVTVDGVSYGDSPFLTIYSSRGCTGSCSFCSTWHIWRHWRQILPQRLADEIEYLHSRNIAHFFIADDSMIADEKFVVGFADEIVRRGLRVFFKIACRADKITPSVVSALKRAGCYEVHVGFESGSQRMLDSMGKKVKVDQNIRAADLLHEAGLRVYALIVIGGIGETVETINETIGFLKRIKPEEIASAGGLMILPGTKDYRTAVRQGLINDDFWQGSDPFLFYTKDFSLKELRLLNLAVKKKHRVWHRRLLNIQCLVFFPWEYANIGGLNFIFRQLLRIYALILRGLCRLWQMVRGRNDK